MKKKLTFFAVSVVILTGVGLLSFNGTTGKSAPNKIPEAEGMVYIPAGVFMMGVNNGPKDCGPAHEVYLPSFYIDKYEVTNAQYQVFVDSTGYPAPYLDPERYPWARKYNWIDGRFPPGTANLPVVLVSWNDAAAYARWAGKRLPTEAEWEKAARGPEGFVYPWGNQWDSTKCNSRSTAINRAVEVSGYAQGASPYGVFNMAGNVWEWCADWYDDDYYASSPEKAPAGPALGATKVIRGGGWDTYGSHRLAAYARESQFPKVRSYDIGFRCVLDADREK